MTLYKPHGREMRRLHADLIEDQHGKCAICRRRGVPLQLDHCHKCGHVRALLCCDCNKGIGLLKDNPRILRSAAYYVTHHSETEEHKHGFAAALQRAKELMSRVGS